MHRLQTIVLAGTVLLTSLAAAPAASPAPAAPATAAAPTPTPDPAIVARAKDWFSRLQNNNPDRSQLNAAMNAGLTADKLAQISAQLKPLGAPVTFDQQQIVKQGDATGYVFSLTFANGPKLVYVFAVDPLGKIDGLRLGVAP